MNTHILQIIMVLLGALTIAALLFPVILHWSKRLNFTDQPSARKAHHKPIPVIGGIGILFSVFILSAIYPPFRHFWQYNPVLSISVVAISFTGIIDDRINMSARTRFLVELLCAFAIAYSGIRITSLYGILGIEHIPLAAQYLLTILVISGVTNAFNLIDGIDGLAGGLALINALMFAVIAILLQQHTWAMLMAAVSGSLMVFLYFNKQPAKLFLGDGGSLLLGFLMSVTAIQLLNAEQSQFFFDRVYTYRNVAVISSFMLIVIDTLRVFARRMLSGRSPFSADRTHIHHMLIAHFMIHKDATRRLLLVHIVLITFSVLLTNWLSISHIVIIELAIIAGYTSILELAQRFSRSYRQVKRMERQR